MKYSFLSKWLLATAVFVLTFGTTQAGADNATKQGGEARLGGTVVMVGGGPVVGVVADFFEANADGSRSRWLGDESTDSSGVFTRSIEPGCYVLVFIAPAGVRFVGGGEFLEEPACVSVTLILSSYDWTVPGPSRSGRLMVATT